ncbi:hypothetical protein ACMD2_13680, partial [Ananas comosus]
LNCLFRYAILDSHLFPSSANWSLEFADVNNNSFFRVDLKKVDIPLAWFLSKKGCIQLNFRNRLLYFRLL